jgi:hypothetical protein
MCEFLLTVSSYRYLSLTFPRANKDVVWYFSLVPFVSFLVALVQCHRKFSTKRVNPPTLALDSPDSRLSSESLTTFHGGPTIFVFLAGRVVACIMLFFVALCLEFPRYDPGLLAKGFDFRMSIYYVRTVMPFLIGFEVFPIAVLHVSLFCCSISNDIPQYLQPTLFHASIRLPLGGL